MFLTVTLKGQKNGCRKSVRSQVASNVSRLLKRRDCWSFLCSVLQCAVVYLCDRFGLSELQLLCKQYTGNPEKNPREQEASPAHEPAAEHQKSLADTQFLELLRFMWEHEDGDCKEVGETKRGIRGQEEDGSGDGEINEDVVNEDELNEIYEFAATQRRMEAEESTENGEDEEGANNCSDAEERHEEKLKDVMEEVTDDADMKSRGPDASLARSYDRLFSESTEEDVEPPRTQTSRLVLLKTPTSRCTSSVREVIDLSISPPPESGEPARELFPVTGVSPGETSDQKLTPESLKGQNISPLPAELENLWCKEPSGSALNKTQQRVTPSTPNCSQPELIVLSDSSEDMDQDLPDYVPSRSDVTSRVDPPRPLISSPSRLGLRHIHMKAKLNTQVELSPKRTNQTSNSVHSEPFRSDQVGSESVLDGSAEVSWLIPATPELSTRTSATQTSSSMRRIRLFPRSGSSTSSISDNPKTSSCSNSLKEPQREHPQPSPAFQSLASCPKTLHHASLNQISPNSTSEPCSSTPLHSDSRPQRLDPLGSPLLKDNDLRTQSKAGQEGRLGSLHLSPSEKLSATQQSSQSPSKFRYCDNSADQEMRNEDKEPDATMPSKSKDSDELIEEGFSFVFDEPPIAFDDSWGLGGEVTEQRPCFSLKLESSGDKTYPPEQRHGQAASLHNTSPSGRGAGHKLPDPGAPHSHRLPDAVMSESWDEDEDKVDALHLSQRLCTVALAKRVSQLRTPGNKSLSVLSDDALVLALTF